MHWRKLALNTAMSLILLVGMVGCPAKAPKVPGAPVGPDQAWRLAPTTYKTATTAKGEIVYVFDWGDNTFDTTDATGSEDTASAEHAWAAEGTYKVKVKAYLETDPEKESEWSPEKSVTVGPNDAPLLVYFWPPTVAVKKVEAYFEMLGDDPDGDRVRFYITWGDNDKGYYPETTYVADSSLFVASHVYNSIDTLEVTCFAEDEKGARSAVSTGSLTVGTSGAVVKYWTAGIDEEPPTTTPLLAAYDQEDIIYTGVSDDPPHFYGVRVSDFDERYSATTHFPEFDFSGHSAYCSQTGHAIVGSDEGELYGFPLNLPSPDWRYPGKTQEESLTYNEWSSPAINGNRLYVIRDEAFGDSLFYFTDNVAGIGRVTASYFPFELTDVPVLDPAGSVYVASDSGYLIKLSDALAPLWSLPLQSNGVIHAPVLGGDGTIYCGSQDSGYFYAVNPDGTLKWKAALDGECSRPAVGQTGVFIGTDRGTLYKFDPASNAPLWTKKLGNSELATTPALAANFKMYVLNDNDSLFCVEQSDGTLVWVCDCPSFIRSRARRTLADVTGYQPSPTIDNQGNVIVVGADALYKVAGYPPEEQGTLDVAAPWPKWQRNHWNTGK